MSPASDPIPSAIAITGASGFVGGAIARAFRQQGAEVLELGRRPAAAQSQWHPFTLGDDPEALPWEKIGTLIHAAWDFRPHRPEAIESINVQGSLRLLQSAHRHGVRRGVFISSMSAFEGCRSLYGQGKLRIEAEALRLGYAAVRPGLVFGDRPGGTLGSIYRVAKLSPILPLIGDGSFPQYLAHVDDLAALVSRLATSDNAPARPLCAAHPEAVPFRELLQRIGQQLDKRLYLIPIPWPLVLNGIRTLETLRLPTPFRSDSLIGLVYQNQTPDFSEAAALQNFRRFEPGGTTP